MSVHELPHGIVWIDKTENFGFDLWQVLFDIKRNRCAFFRREQAQGNSVEQVVDGIARPRNDLTGIVDTKVGDGCSATGFTESERGGSGDLQPDTGSVGDDGGCGPGYVRVDVSGQRRQSVRGQVVHRTARTAGKC